MEDYAGWYRMWRLFNYFTFLLIHGKDPPFESFLLKKGTSFETSICSKHIGIGEKILRVPIACVKTRVSFQTDRVMDEWNRGSSAIVDEFSSLGFLMEIEMRSSATILGLFLSTFSPLTTTSTPVDLFRSALSRPSVRSGANRKDKNKRTKRNWNPFQL